MRERTLLFPEDVAVGWVEPWCEGARLPVMPARGTVRVPEDALVFLDLFAPVRGLGCLGPDDVYSLHPFKRSPVDAEMERLAHLTGLRELHLSKAHALGDAGVAHLAPLRRLRVLDLYWTAVTDASLLHLAGMVSLRRLHLGMTRVTGAGLRLLSGLQRLEWLSLEDTDVDDSAVPHLAALRGLRKIALWGTLLSRAGIARLQAALPAAEILARDPGRRLARERSARALLRILARRLPDRRFAEAPPRDRLCLLLPPGTVFEWQVDSVTGPLCRFSGDTEDLALHLRGLPAGAALRITAPDGRVWRMAWLRRRIPGGRRRDGQRRGGRRRADGRAPERRVTFH